jgi:hypothetical protein
MSTNRFELRLRLEKSPVVVAFGEQPTEELWLIPEIWIDGIKLDEPHPICVNAVLQSLAKPGPRTWGNGWHYVFTCGCGTPACADIDEGVGSVHHDESVEWVFRRPQANRFGSDVLGFKQWCETATWHQYQFDRHQATVELIRFLDEVWQVLLTSEIDLASKEDLLRWFADDPRYYMRYRSSDWLTVGTAIN